MDEEKAWWATRFILILPSARSNWKLNTVKQKDCIYIYKVTWNPSPAGLASQTRMCMGTFRRTWMFWSVWTPYAST